MSRGFNKQRQETELLERASFRGIYGNSHSDDFEQIAVPHMTALYNQAIFLTKNPDDAQDLVQETFLKAYRFWDSFEQGTNIRGWLFQIMKNSYINHYRKRTKEPKAVEFDEQLSYGLMVKDAQHETHHDDVKNPHDVFEDEVARSLESLPSDFRAVVIMSDLEDFTYDEIASAMSVPVGTVRSRLHRGRKLLRERLHKYARSNRCLV